MTPAEEHAYLVAKIHADREHAAQLRAAHPRIERFNIRALHLGLFLLGGCCYATAESILRGWT